MYRRWGDLQPRKKRLEKKVRWPGIEPGSTAWKATMLTFTPPTQLEILVHFEDYKQNSTYVDPFGTVHNGKALVR